MNDKPENKPETGLYERTVGRITDAVKPYLHQKTKDFVEKSVEKHAADNPRLARMIEFEVKRRGDGAGLTQDVSEPILWIGIKTIAALAIGVLGESINNRGFKLIGRVTALTTMLNNGVEIFRVVPRYVAGLQGSLEMAKDRWRAIEETGVDPFDHGGRLIHKPKDNIVDVTLDKSEEVVEKNKKWTTDIQPKDLTEVKSAEFVR